MEQCSKQNKKKGEKICHYFVQIPLLLWKWFKITKAWKNVQNLTEIIIMQFLKEPHLNDTWEKADISNFATAEKV